MPITKAKAKSVLDVLAATPAGLTFEDILEKLAKLGPEVVRREVIEGLGNGSIDIRKGKFVATHG